MKLKESLYLAIGMYSRFPVPRTEWREENMDYVFCFFPLVGVLVGVCQYARYQAGNLAGAGRFLMAALLTVLPLFLTGKIHMDGYLDTLDALGSWGDREKKLAILKDSHTGAFGVIGCGIYLLLSFGAWCEVDTLPQLSCICLGYVLSRSLSGFSVVTFPKAGQADSTVAVFSRAARTKTVRATLVCQAVGAGGLLLFLTGILGLCCLAVLLLVFAYYYGMSRKQFGGITGDLAGYFLQTGELAVLLTAALGKGLCI